MTQTKLARHSAKGLNRSTPEGWLTYEFDLAIEHTGQSTAWKWPNAKYRLDPCGFFEEVLGLPVWGDHDSGMRAMLEYIRDYDRVAIRAGRKVSKSFSLAGIALWWFTSHHDAKVTITAPTARQVEKTNWNDVKNLHKNTQNPLNPELFDDHKAILEYNPQISTRPIDGVPRGLARSGVQVGARLIAGFTAKEGVAAQGPSGVHQLYLVDEASGIPQDIIDAIIGNMAGGGKLILFGNPTKSEDEFYEAFNEKKLSESRPFGYKCLTISSEESPNVKAGRRIIPGLALPSYIEERKIEWGEESALYRVHVKGEHVEIEEGKIIPLHLIKEAEDRWDAEGDAAVVGEGILHIGIDPAFSASGDEAVFVARRGLRMLDMLTFRGLSEDEHLVHLLGLIKTHAKPGETVVVNLDCLGSVGAKVMYVLQNYAAEHPKEFILCCIRGSDNAIRDPKGFIRVRDELWGSLFQWLRDGGAIVPNNVRLVRDLHAPSWIQTDLKQRKAVTPKDDLRKALKRSPDRGDALCLACWENSKAALEAAQGRQEEQQQERTSLLAEPAANGMDAYAGVDWFEGQGR